MFKRAMFHVKSETNSPHVLQDIPPNLKSLCRTISSLSDQMDSLASLTVFVTSGVWLSDDALVLLIVYTYIYEEKICMVKYKFPPLS